MYCTVNYITQALVAGHMIGHLQNHLCYSLLDKAIWLSFAYAAMA